MRIFITGATGFIGSAVVQELINAGHQVLGLARSDEGVAWLTSVGAHAHRGSLEDPASLQSGAADADAVIHNAFSHDFSKFAENCETDRRAIEALGDALAGSNRSLMVAAGLAGLAKPGELATEESVISPHFPFPRVSEQTALAQISKGVAASVMRLPQVHDTRRQGLVSFTILIARQKGTVAYVGEEANRWAAAHVSDVARLYRLAIEKNEAGAKYHAVAEEGVRARDIAETVARGLNLPVVSLSPEEAQGYFGWMGGLAGADIIASSAITRQKFGWNPAGPGLIADLEKMDYNQA